MYSKENTPTDADKFFQLVIRAAGNDLAVLKKRIIEYGIALKLAIRTFKFNSHE